MSFLDTVLPEIRASLDRIGSAGPAATDPRPSRPARSLAAAVRGAPGGWAILLEHKRRSPGAADPELPSEGPAVFVRRAEAAGADALSCLATSPSFGGSVEDVRAVAAAATRPVLCKDLVIDPRQIAAARHAGADAILLIARLEQEGRTAVPLRRLAEEASRAGLEVLLEFHAPEELKLADEVPAAMWGVNLRDLGSLAFRPDVVRETARRLAGRGPFLGLSGVEGPEGARRWRSWGAGGILVGTGFARARDPVAFVRELRAAAVKEGPG
ncbi:MAG: indole-3-glycerol-phosphate synthase TrpC [Thermoplasmata archaeon]